MIKHLLSLSLLISSCQMNLGTGLLAGGTLGSGLGSITAGGKGALIGSAAGVIVGGIFGSILDTQDRNVMEKSSPRTVDRMDRGDPLTINDVIKLSQGGISDSTILSYMEETGSTYNLSRVQVRRLQDAGVSERIILYMVETTQ